MQNLFNLTGRVAVVTGGAGLLGAQFCQTLASAGAQVVVADLSLTAAGAIAQDIVRQGGQAFAVEVDVTEAQAVHNMVAVALQAYGRLDILVNSAALDPKFDAQHRPAANRLAPTGRDAGSGQDAAGAAYQEQVHRTGYSAGAGQIETQNLASLSGPGAAGGWTGFEDFPLEAWNQSLAVNLTGVFLCCQAAVRPMLEQGNGVIINLSSIYGLVAPDQRMYQQPGQPPQYKPVYYSVTKSGILGLTRYLAAYYAGKNIRVNALSPGGVYNGHDPAFVQAYSARAVMGRMAEKDEMNGALLFLASDASQYMTGADLVIDGGWTTW